MAKAMYIFSEDNIKNGLGTIGLLDFLDAQYRVINGDANRIITAISTKEHGFPLFRGGFLHYFNNFAEGYRIVYFISQMIEDGTFDAHIMVNGKMVYDEKLDNRFKVLFDGTSQNTEAYKIAKVKYDFIKSEMEKELGRSLKTLPKAYTYSETEALLEISKKAFGSISKEDRTIVQETLLGSIWGVYKASWLPAYLSKYFKSYDYHPNMSKLEVEEYDDENGQKQYKAVFKGEHSEGIFISIIHTFHSLKNGKINGLDLTKDVLLNQSGSGLDEFRKRNLRKFFADLALYLIMWFISIYTKEALKEAAKNKKKMSQEELYNFATYKAMNKVFNNSYKDLLITDVLGVSLLRPKEFSGSALTEFSLIEQYLSLANNFAELIKDNFIYDVSEKDRMTLNQMFFKSNGLGKDIYEYIENSTYEKKKKEKKD
jgi:hypothetical protein